MNCFRSNVQTWISSHRPFLNPRWMSGWALRKVKKFPWRANLSVRSRWKHSQLCLKTKVCSTEELGSLASQNIGTAFLTARAAQWHRMFHPLESLKRKAVPPACVRSDCVHLEQVALLQICTELHSWFPDFARCKTVFSLSILQEVLSFYCVAWFWNSLSLFNQKILV